MKENIFQPLKMDHTRLYNTRRTLKDTIANYAYGYVYNDSLKKYLLPDNDPKNDFVICFDGIMGDGIVNSTTADLLKWTQSIKENALLKKETQAEMLKPHALVDTAKQVFYGYGVFIKKDSTGTTYFHSGGWPGYVTFLTYNFDRDQIIVVLSNNMAESPAIAENLQRILAGDTIRNNKNHKSDLEVNKDVVRNYHKVWSDGNLRLLDSILSPEFVCHFIGGLEWRGIEGAKTSIANHKKAFPDWSEEIVDIIAEADKVVTRYKSTGTHRGTFNGMDSTGIRVEIYETSIYRIENGKIIEQWGFPDEISLRTQLQAK